ncbi:MAG TPA: FAD-dependent oxidoreductase [Candidatus Dormibacteraeota bacterium]|nr:FAD-dependent oxidoreductase [Candidatus Dormibacteraeota bacterium]
MPAPSSRSRVCNVLVIGTGAAGLRAAIAATEAGSQVLVVGKRHRLDAHTVLAAGGINAVLGTRDPQDTWEQHFADTFREGYLLGHPRVVEIMAREAPDAVRELADWGCQFARLDDGRLDQRFFGAHKYRRTCYAGDYTGRAVLYTLANRAQQLGIPVIEDQYISRLLVADGVCFGAYGFDLVSGDRTVFEADAVVLAAGGHTRLWRRSSSRRDENYGEGMFLALEAGCRLMDMELVQFHPTGMVMPEEIAGTLVTEAVRGEGGHLYNRDHERFMKRYDPERMELSARDRVALAIYTEIIEGRGGPNGGVFLDISHLPKDVILEKLPRMYRQFIEYQMLDISKQPMEVAPTAHYSMGGIVVDPETHATNAVGLYAAGECTSGLHGANRLGGNSLAETVIFGRRAGAAAAAHSQESEVQRRSKKAVQEAEGELQGLIKPGSELARPLQRALRDLMWEHCGVVRDETRMRDGLRKLGDLAKAAESVDIRPGQEGWVELEHVLDLRAGLRTAEATLRCALERRESRGAHTRSDFPNLDPGLERNFYTRAEGADRPLTVWSEPVPPISAPLKRMLTDEEMEVAGRLLE